MLVLLPFVALAQNISGTFSGSFTGFDAYGIASVHMDLSLQCSLSCPSSAPALHYGYNGSKTEMEANPMLSPAVMVAYVDSATGQASWDAKAPVGSNFTATVKSASCWCGNITGEGGFIDLTTTPIQVPPWFHVLSKTVTVGHDPLILLEATPVSTELVNVHISGGGVDFAHSYTAADFKTETSGNVANKSISIPIVFASAGTVTLTATVGDGPMQVQTITVTGSGSTGGGTSSPDAGSAGPGGSSGSSEGSDGAAGCASAPGLMIFAAMLLLLKLRVRK
ncbi:MAG: hypothetical protein QM723_00230 [Myxococcaceae bacterium]